MLLAIFSFLQRERANQAREKATTACAAADEVVSYMQYDLRERLGTIGRLDLMKAINDRIALYHQQHPPDPGDAKAKDKGDRERSVMRAPCPRRRMRPPLINTPRTSRLRRGRASCIRCA